MRKYLEGPNGPSMMRLIAFIGVCVGSVVVLWGMGLITKLVGAVVSDANVQAAAALGTMVLIVTAGAGMIGASEIMKGIQQRSEKKDQP